MDAVKRRMAELSADDDFMLFGACTGHILKNEPKEEARAKMVAVLELAVNPPNPPQDAYRETEPPAYEARYLEEHTLVPPVAQGNLSSSCCAGTQIRFHFPSAFFL
ncbi:unnamed protein product [Cylicocyclus nassatus]|uniref:Uncharacterized protein n=1 Tax=Cylicocyclus nassatus TaxID=53992 RepID=A0AA36HBT8_CYLNA|nr:unnamed protein product [Cylicocyclus nassatus]